MTHYIYDISETLTVLTKLEYSAEDIVPSPKIQIEKRHENTVNVWYVILEVKTFTRKSTETQRPSTSQQTEQ